MRRECSERLMELIFLETLWGLCLMVSKLDMNTLSSNCNGICYACANSYLAKHLKTQKMFCISMLSCGFT